MIVEDFSITKMPWGVSGYGLGLGLFLDGWTSRGSCGEPGCKLRTGGKKTFKAVSFLVVTAIQHMVQGGSGRGTCAAQCSVLGLQRMFWRLHAAGGPQTLCRMKKVPMYR